VTIVDARPLVNGAMPRAFYFAADVQTLYHRSSDKAIAYCQIVAAIKLFMLVTTAKPDRALMFDEKY
jgi:hypothetical protein